MNRLPMFDTDELSEFIHISPDTLRYWRHIGKGPSSSRWPAARSSTDKRTWTCGSRSNTRLLLGPNIPSHLDQHSSREMNSYPAHYGSAARIETPAPRRPEMFNST